MAQPQVENPVRLPSSSSIIYLNGPANRIKLVTLVNAKFLVEAVTPPGLQLVHLEHVSKQKYLSFPWLKL